MPDHPCAIPRDLPTDWLLEGPPFVRRGVLVELLGLTDADSEVQQAKSRTPEDIRIKRLLLKRNRLGYWGTPRDIFTWWPKKDTTFWVLGVLAEFGLRRDDCAIDRACEYVLNTQLPCGAFGVRPPPQPYECFTGVLTESLAKLGYLRDERLQLAYQWLVGRQRLDGGFWCKNTGQPDGSRQGEPSCAFATLCVLRALLMDPTLQSSGAARRSGEFLLGCRENRDRIKYAGHDSQIGRGWEKLKYPFTDYRILMYLDALSRLLSTKTDPRVVEMVKLVMSKRDDRGRFRSESIHKVWSDFDFGQKERPSRWITFLVYRIAARLSPTRQTSVVSIG